MERLPIYFNLTEPQKQKEDNFMKKSFKKIVAIVLTAAITMTTTIPAFAENNNKPTGDLFAQEFSETISIEGVEYTYQYSYNEDGNETIVITNNENDRVDVVTLDESNSAILLNDKIAATIDTVASTELSNLNEGQIMPQSGWVRIGSPETKTITIEDAETVDQVAAIIRIGLTAMSYAYSQFFSITIATVIAKMGTIFLQAYVWANIEATLYGEFYQMVSLGSVQYRYDWTFTDRNGRTSGPHSWFTVANPSPYSLGETAA